VATYSPLVANTTLMWLCAVVNFQTALDTVINAYAPQKFMDERGFSPQVVSSPGASSPQESTATDPMMLGPTVHRFVLPAGYLLPF